ncbi:hypothetical protein HELRODRAFT_175930 [Helobdella robusta]|uniref:Uncharacterized protein n=1 Tax=Helobdella robusta TaxID=6412 RepID=T1F9X1_HELRO|nr:hypothetical protein HELRODRAFT_175930 [Helobdella robusta]ESO00493.1 hypothetical protein HELRODRAFT_175930 [Helobdella robusta]
MAALTKLDVRKKYINFGKLRAPRMIVSASWTGRRETHFISALKTLKTELETQNLDKLDNVLEKCSLFASVNLAKVPNLDNIIKVNFKNLKNEIKEMLYAQQVKIVNAIDMHGIEISTLNNKINFLASKRDNYNFASHSSNTSTAIFPEKNNIVTMPNPANSATLWSDVVQSPLEDNPLPFSIVARNKKRPRLNNSPETNQPNPAITSNKLESSKLPTKIVGAKKNDNNKLSADKKLIKKSVFAMSNIKKCSRSNVIDYLSEVGIQVISCYPVQKRSLAPSGTLPRNEDEDSTMFRVCINASDTSKIQDPDNLPENVIIREWRFLNSKSGQTTSTNNG